MIIIFPFSEVGTISYPLIGISLRLYATVIPFTFTGSLSNFKVQIFPPCSGFDNVIIPVALFRTEEIFSILVLFTYISTFFA